jgi:hypothetical protein
MHNKTRQRQIRMKRAITKIQPPEIIQVIYLHLKEYIETERDRPKLEITIDKKVKALKVIDKTTRYVVIYISYMLRDILNQYFVSIRCRADLIPSDCDNIPPKIVGNLVQLKLDITDPQLIEKLEQAITNWK